MQINNVTITDIDQIYSFYRIASDYQKAKENPTKFLKLAKDDTLKIKGIIKTAMHREFIAYRNFAFYDGAGDLIVSVNRNDDEIETMVGYLNSNKGQKLYEYLKQAVC